MTAEPVDSSDDFWSTADVAGTSSTWLFDGQDGLDRLSGPVTFSAPDPAAFHARLVRVQIDHIALEGLAATAYTSVRSAEQIAATRTPVLSFAYVKAGHLRVELADDAFDVGPGEMFVLDGRDPATVSATSEVRVLLSMIGLEHIPAHLLSRGTTIAAALPRTALIDSFIAFQATILSSSMRGQPAEGDHLIRAIADLHTAVLAEAQHLSGKPSGLAGLRHRMEEHIDAHLADRGLTPETLAAAMGISVRYAHVVFNEGDRTIGRFIRERRIEAVATTLRTHLNRIAMDELAARHGFAGSEALGRAFRARYGMSVGEYRSGGHRPRD